MGRRTSHSVKHSKLRTEQFRMVAPMGVRAVIGDTIGSKLVSTPLAGVTGMSRAAFFAEFARCVGQPPLTYLRSWRLTLARAALARGEGTVAVVANSVGYGSQSAFAHAYRRVFGVPPTSHEQHC